MPGREDSNGADFNGGIGCNSPVVCLVLIALGITLATVLVLTR